MKEIIDRFLKSIIKQPNGCWERQTTSDRDGYTHFTFNYNTMKSHRFSAKYLGGLDIDGLCVCHHCDNPRCVNPEHLFVGTHGDNVRDKVFKGRQPKGNNHHFFGKVGPRKGKPLSPKQKEVLKSFAFKPGHIPAVKGKSPIMTDHGIMESCLTASIFYKVHDTTIRNWLKNEKKHNFYMIKEQL